MRVGSVAAVAAAGVAVVAVALLLPKMNGIQWRRQRPVFFTSSFVGGMICQRYTHTHWRNQKTVAYLSKRQTDASSKEANVLKNNSKKLSHTTAWATHFLVIRNDTTYESVGRMWIV